MKNLSEIIHKTALDTGFDDCGLTNVRKIDETERKRFDNWLKSGYNAKMQWIEKNIDVRFNPELLLDNTKTAVVVLHSHNNLEQKLGNNKIARFALQEDYHKTIRNKLRILSEKIKDLIPETNTRICVDTAPILEKYWAQIAGLGFVGRNTLFISPKIGSFCNIGILLLDKNIEINVQSLKEVEIKKADFCENCNRCINSCPTKALVSPFTLDCNKCISYQNQYKSEEGFDCFGWERGCDICQDVCPFNKQIYQQ